MKKFLRLSYILISLLFSCKTAEIPVVSLPEINVDSGAQFITYRAAYNTYLDLIHTTIKIKPDFQTKTIPGIAVLSLKPHFYPTDSLVLNAKGMTINSVKVNDTLTEYNYDGKFIVIHCNKMYNKNDTLIVSINYISKPEEYAEGGSDAIISDKGFFFIDPDSLDPEKPTQFWTQGETESNSVWFPTIESPSQKMSQDIFLTVDAAFTTVSNGILLSSKTNNDGTKTDHWQQHFPMAPYLTMVAAGKFNVIKDTWRNKEVSYYVDPPYEKYARMIYGKTPSMIEYFSELLKVEYPYDKYSQIAVHDYVSGAMENNTAVIHGTNMNLDYGSFMDNTYEEYIAHELFHHWFGNMVTCRSWSNVTLNEGFASYGEYLWFEKEYGRDFADEHLQDQLRVYLYQSKIDDSPLIRYFYKDREDVYDGISYHKGSRILHMLRKTVGDSAFFSSINFYLNQNMFGTAEADDLRHAFEKVTGQDLHWFFDQWFFKGGIPSLDISYKNDTSENKIVIIKQKQKNASIQPYKLPIAIDFYFGNNVIRKNVVIEKAIEEFKFNLPGKADLINVDAEKMLAATITDNKTSDQWRFQFYHAPLYLDRFEAVNKIGKNYKTGTADEKMILDALKDDASGIRMEALKRIGEAAKNDTASSKPLLIEMIRHDKSSDVREEALRLTAMYFPFSETKYLIINSLKDTSYNVKARAFKILTEKDTSLARNFLPEIMKDSGSAVFSEVTYFLASHPQPHYLDYFKRAYAASGYGRYDIIRNLQKFIINSNDELTEEAGVDFLLHKLKVTKSANQKSAHGNALSAIRSSYKTKSEENKSNKEKIAFYKRMIQKITDSTK